MSALGTTALGAGLVTSPLGLGCMGMSQSYGTPDDAESEATIHRALDLGVTFLDTFRELGIGLVPYSPIGRGFLSGEITSPADFGPNDFRRTHPRFTGENFDRNLAIVHEVQRIAAEKGVTAAQLAIAWVLAQGDDIVPIPGTKRRRYLEENIGALDVTLTAEDLAAIEAVAPKDVAAGERYAPDSPTRPAWA